MEIPQFSIIVPTRNNKNLLELCLKSCRENLQNKEHEIIVMDDNSQDGTKEWLEENKEKYNFKYFTHNDERHGLMILVEEGIKNSTCDIIAYVHDDMHLSPLWDGEMFKYLKKGKTIVSGTRIEPPIYWPEPAKYIRDFGFSAKDFDVNAFNLESEKIRKSTFDIKESFFAPHLFYKQDWIGYDMNYLPQSREDSLEKNRLIYVFKDKKMEIIPIQNLFNKYEKYIEKTTESEFINFNKNKIKIQTFSVNKDKVITIKPINKIIRHKVNKKMYIIRNGLGETIVTEDHSLIDNNFKCVKPQEIERLLIPKSYNWDKVRRYIDKNVDLLNYLSEETKSKLKWDNEKIWLDTIAPNSICKIKRFYKADEYGNGIEIRNVCYWLGLLSAEGLFSQLGIGFVNCDNNLSEKYRNTLPNFLYDYHIQIRNEKERYVPQFEGTIPPSQISMISSKLLSIITNDILGGKSDRMKVPTLVLNLPLVYQKWFLYGYLEGDGWVGKSLRKEPNIDHTIKLSKDLIFDYGMMEHLQIKFSTKSMALVSGLNYIINRIYPERSNKIRWKPEKECYDLASYPNESKKESNIEVSLFSEDINDYVYDLEVKDTHNFLDACGNIVLHNTVLGINYMQKGYKLINSRSALCYHFSGRGSRKKDGIGKDSDEWKSSNSKNERNIIRQFGHSPLVTDFIKPVLHVVPKISCVMLLGKGEKDYVFKKLLNEEPYYDEIIFVADEGTEEELKEVKRYVDEEREISKLFDANKIMIVRNKLDMNFEKAHNLGQEACKNEIVFHSDMDEYINKKDLDKIKITAQGMIENADKKVVGFMRQNYIDNVPTNDLKNNPDVQFRLVRKEIKWLSNFGVHESPEPAFLLRNGDTSKTKEVSLSKDIIIHHAKSSERQKKQNEFYNQILKAKMPERPKKIIFNSVLSTFEGITEHARQELKQLDKLGYQIQITEQFSKRMPEEYKKYYTPFAREEDYVYYINQPPIRENWPDGSIMGHLHEKNLVVFLALEGIPPQPWAQVLGHQNIKKILTPSEYSKECMVKAGVNPSKIKILHHGVDTAVYNPQKATLKFDKFTFLVAGTFHLPLDRKGLDLAIRAFNEAFDNNDKVCMIIKANKIYNKDVNMNKLVNNMLPTSGNRNILVIENDLSEEECAQLLASVNCFVQPIRAGGFEMWGLEALASSTPLISTMVTGEKEYVTPEKALIIECNARTTLAPLVHPYENSRWFEPKVESIKEQMLEVYNNYSQYKERAEKIVPEIVKEYSWDKIGLDLDKELSEI